jgi:hypothetical protein
MNNQLDEGPGVYNGHMEVEVVIDRPVSEVWPRFLDFPSWMTSHQIEEVYGSRSVGSITRVFTRNAKEWGLPTPHYHYCKIIKLITEKQYLLKSYSEKGGSYGLQMVGFDDARLSSVGGRTLVTFNFFAQVIAKDVSGMNVENSRPGMLTNLENLKRMVERNHPER